MRKRSSYRPKKILANPVGFVLEGFVPLREMPTILVALKIKHHDALTALTKGVATVKDIDILINAVNMTEALYRIGVGEEYGAEVHAALDALRQVARRGILNEHKFTLRASEMNALNAAIELHDAQLDVITLNQLEQGVEIVRKEFARGKATPIGLGRV